MWASVPAFQHIHVHSQILALHDVSDGGAAVTLLEMGLAGGVGLSVDLQHPACTPIDESNSMTSAGEAS